MKFSVCIPTFNRPAGLVRALDGFQRQSYNKPFEIIVVDNACDNEIKELVHHYNKTAMIKVKYFAQEGGIQQVRSRLVIESRGNLILMIDDDESPGENLLDVYDRVFSRYKDLAAAGGPCVVKWEDTPPDWVLGYMEGKRVSNLWGRYEPQDDFQIGKDVGIWGGNMVLKREVFEYTGFRPDVFKRKNLGSGETGLLNEISSRNLKTAFVPDAQLFHYMDKSRFNLKYVRHTASYMGVPIAYRRWHKSRKSFFEFSAEIFKIIKHHYKFWIKWITFVCFKRKKTRQRINVEFWSNVGLYQIKYIYWILTDPYIRLSCDWDDFRPESCLRLYEEYFKKPDRF